MESPCFCERTNYQGPCLSRYVLGKEEKLEKTLDELISQREAKVKLGHHFLFWTILSTSICLFFMLLLVTILHFTFVTSLELFWVVTRCHNFLSSLRLRNTYDFISFLFVMCIQYFFISFSFKFVFQATFGLTFRFF